MIEKCHGCGAEIQFIDKNLPGFIKEEVYQKRLEENKDILCERCFKLKNYNEVEKITINEDSFLELVKNNVTNNMLICYIVDIFDLTGTIIPNINEIFPHNNILVIGNKYDLFMRSNRPTKLKKYLNEYLEAHDIKTIGTIITSGCEELSAKKVYETICKTITNNNLSKEVFFFGMSNSGKTTLLKSIGNLFNSSESKQLLTSKAISTTIGLSKIDLGDITIVDSPGLVNDRQFTYYLNKKSIDLIMPKSVIKPSIFQLNKDQSILILGFAIFSVLESDNKKTSVIVYTANNIKLHRTKYEESALFLEKHRKDLFTIPNKNERSKLGEMVDLIFDLDCCEEIAISGIGFISVNGRCKVNVRTFEKIKVEKRKKMI